MNQQLVETLLKWLNEELCFQAATYTFTLRCYFDTLLFQGEI